MFERIEVNKIPMNRTYFQLFMFFGLSFAINVSGQADSTKKRVYEHKAMYNVNLMRTDLRNWTQGGESNTNGSLMIREQLKVQSQKATGKHLLQLNYGLNNTKGTTTKTIDNLQYVGNFSRGGIDDKRLIRLSTQIELNTQAMPGYAVEDTAKTTMISNIGSPVYAQFSLGAISNRYKSWSLYFAPLGTKTTIVLDPEIRELGAFGVDSTSSALLEGGANATLTYNKVYWRTFKILLRTDFFYNYFDENPELDVRGELISYYKLDKWFTMNINYQFIRDFDAYEGWQLKSVAGLGITITLN